MKSRWTIEYFTNSRGMSPIKSFIDRLPVNAKARTIKTFDLLETYGISIGFPYVKQMQRNLWELRIKVSDGSFRYLFTITKNKVIIILHCIQKKSQKIPRRDLELAIKRLKELE